jgi:putative colanic acid biosynthesis UDP-glucose lipid carrier transferase
MIPSGLLKEYFRVVALFVKALDLVLIMLAGWFTYWIKFGAIQITPPYLLALVCALTISLFLFPACRLYQSIRSDSFLHYMMRIIQAIFMLTMILAGLGFLAKVGEIYSRIWFVSWMLSSLILLVLTRCILIYALRTMRARGMNERRVVILGATELGGKLAEAVQQALWTGFRVITILDDQASSKPSALQQVSIQQTPDDLARFLKQNAVDEIWIALPLEQQSRMSAVLHELRHETITTRLVLDIFGLDLLNHSVTDLAGFPVLNIRSTPMTGMNRLLKAIEDRVLAALILLLISPLLVVIALGVKLTSRGPIFFRQKRVGWNGHEFEMLKFRTMPVNAEAKTGPVWATAQDNRATFIGKFLRRTSLDELPQFINVLKGEMSIVGPRPERKVFVDEFKEKVPRYMQKHVVKAGITGWAQVNGWRGNTSLEKRIEYDLYYIENWSIFFDIKIIFYTIFKGFINPNAY